MYFDHPCIIKHFGSWAHAQMEFYDFVFKEGVEFKLENRKQSIVCRKFVSFNQAWCAFIDYYKYDFDSFTPPIGSTYELAYLDGFIAATIGENASNNPYELGSINKINALHYSWHEGFEHANEA